MNSTSPSAPASSSRIAISPIELKCGLSFTATGTDTASLTCAQDLDVPVLDVAPAGVRVAGHEVDVELDRRGSGILHRAGEARPAARGCCR